MKTKVYYKGTKFHYRWDKVKSTHKIPIPHRSDWPLYMLIVVRLEGLGKGVDNWKEIYTLVCIESPKKPSSIGSTYNTMEVTAPYKHGLTEKGLDGFLPGSTKFRDWFIDHTLPVINPKVN